MAKKIDLHFEQYSDITSYNISEFMNIVKEFATRNGIADYNTVYFDIDHDGEYISMHAYRSETDEEFEIRVAEEKAHKKLMRDQAKKDKKIKEEKERELYEKLKEKFES